MRDRHSDERPFSCQVCSYSAKHMYHLTVHLRSHTGDSPYRCEEPQCRKSFCTRSDLKRHRRCHSGEQPFKCDICGFASSFRANVVKHIRVRHGSTPGTEALRDTCQPGKEAALPGGVGPPPQKQRRGPAAPAGRGRNRNTYRANHWCQLCSASFVREEAYNAHLSTHGASAPESASS
ncbi:zinc finger protein 699-like [Pollicipes pollicipes]|uniref:zinc finger protein 699-like n=1 Tax=Pollicipes pollicipes TaxID=41117 RepID=UPI0018849741|nr:zinc finger protein 699-like [Pollicipes pollicipes]